MDDENENERIGKYFISIDTFENMLYNFQERYSDLKKHKNSYHIYQSSNRYLKMFNDGLCYCFTKKYKENNVEYDGKKNKLLYVIEEHLSSDMFPINKDYHTITRYSEIVFTVNPSLSVIFSEMENETGFKKYAVYLDINDKEKDSEKEKMILNGVGLISSK